jgi:hypothetical protein
VTWIYEDVQRRQKEIRKEKKLPSIFPYRAIKDGPGIHTSYIFNRRQLTLPLLRAKTTPPIIG